MNLAGNIGNSLEMNSKGIRRKKSSLTEVKIAVIGAPSVGKSGMYVYFRFIYI